MSPLSTFFPFSVYTGKCVPIRIFNRHLSTNKPLLKSSRIFLIIHTSEYISYVISKFPHDHLIIRECPLYRGLFSFNMHLALAFTLVHLPLPLIDVSVFIEHSAFTPVSLEFQHHSFIYVSCWIPNFTIISSILIELTVFEKTLINSLS
jgi:hypothetical protein